jgi:hypothetical protein
MIGIASWPVIGSDPLQVTANRIARVFEWTLLLHRSSGNVFLTVCAISDLFGRSLELIPSFVVGPPSEAKRSGLLTRTDFFIFSTSYAASIQLARSRTWIEFSDHFVPPIEGGSKSAEFWFSESPSDEGKFGSGTKTSGGSTLVIAVFAALAVLILIAGLVICLTLRRRKTDQTTGMIYDTEVELHGECVDIAETDDFDDEDLDLTFGNQLEGLDADSMTMEVVDNCEEVFGF